MLTFSLPSNALIHPPEAYDKLTSSPTRFKVISAFPTVKKKQQKNATIRSLCDFQDKWRQKNYP